VCEVLSLIAFARVGIWVEIRFVGWVVDG
jgi:hypothetical protein